MNCQIKFFLIWKKKPGVTNIILIKNTLNDVKVDSYNIIDLLSQNATWTTSKKYSLTRKNLK
jgi:hypothetical protein